ncbi:MAG: hypothetical protein GY705_23995 [Bacteroidetes bacterium]|nr:hypothetical protein [Bacteroidota bacterium]
MKYLLSIVIIIAITSLLTFYLLRPPAPLEHNDPLLTINGHTISRTTIQNLTKTKGHHSVSDQDKIDSIITKTLLIEEAQRLNIDREASFRASLKNYYEQSLIKVVTERQYSKIDAEVSEQEIDQYISHFGRTFTFTLLNSNTLPSSVIIRRDGELRSVLFDELSKPFKQEIAGLLPGETGFIFVTGSEGYAVLLNNIKGKGILPATINREKIAKSLIEHKKEKEITNWINDLRQKASIILHEGKP